MIVALCGLDPARNTRRILTLGQALTELGAVNYAVARYASDYRQRGAWGMFRHEMRHGLLIEGSIPPRPAAKPLRR